MKLVHAKPQRREDSGFAVAVPSVLGLAAWSAVGTRALVGYMAVMAKAHSTLNETVVRDARSGRFVAVRGMGALKGHLAIRKGVDLTKPIAAKGLKGAKGRTGGSAGIERERAA